MFAVASAEGQIVLGPNVHVGQSFGVLTCPKRSSTGKNLRFSNFPFPCVVGYKVVVWATQGVPTQFQPAPPVANRWGLHAGWLVARVFSSWVFSRANLLFEKASQRKTEAEEVR